MMTALLDAPPMNRWDVRIVNENGSMTRAAKPSLRPVSWSVPGAQAQKRLPPQSLAAVMAPEARYAPIRGMRLVIAWIHRQATQDPNFPVRWKSVSTDPPPADGRPRQ